MWQDPCVECCAPNIFSIVWFYFGSQPIFPQNVLANISLIVSVIDVMLFRVCAGNEVGFPL